MDLARPPVIQTAVFVDTAASHHMVPAESRLCQHAANKIDCSGRVKGSCGLPSATSKGTLACRLRNDRGELVPIHLEVLVVPDLGASAFSVGALHDKGVKLDLLSNAPCLRDGNDDLSRLNESSTDRSLCVSLDGQEAPEHASHTTVDTDTWHRRMRPCRPRAFEAASSKTCSRGEYY